MDRNSRNKCTRFSDARREQAKRNIKETVPMIRASWTAGESCANISTNFMAHTTFRLSAL